MNFQPALPAFRPAFGVYGSPSVTEESAQTAVDALSADAPKEDASIGTYINYFNKSSDGIRDLLFGKDARTQAAILKARLANLKAERKKYAKIPVIGKNLSGLLDAQIKKLQAEYNALAVQAQEDQYAANTKLALGTAGVGLAVLGGVALLQFILLLRARTKAIQ